MIAPSATRLSWICGLVAGLLVLLTLGGPGITIDEPLDVRPGRTYVDVLTKKGLHFFDPEVVTSVFADNAEHPPLGRWLLGIASIAGESFAGLLGGPDPFDVHSGRLAPALAFAGLVVLVSGASGRRYGRAGALGSAFSLIAMPRVFAHAHLAALDTFLCFFWVAALLSSVRSLDSKRPILAMSVAGIVWGLALLTKIHAWLLPPIVLIWALTRLKPRKAIASVAVWTSTGLLSFFGGWPWLWYDSIDRLKAYLLGTSLARLSLRVEYFGQFFADRDVPWHYPWLYFAITVPIGLHALGLVGSIRGFPDRKTDHFPKLILGSIGVFLVLFSTRIAVYDGERLFLVAFPLWSILIGRGFALAWAWCGDRRPLRACGIVFLMAQAYGVIAMYPFGLSYYNALVGGLPGAEALGLELTYWGDAVDPVLLDRLSIVAKAGQSASIAPTLHHVQALADTTPGLLAKSVSLRDESAVGKSEWAVIYRRRAYWSKKVEALSKQEPIFVRKRQGVWLSGIWRSRE